MTSFSSFLLAEALAYEDSGTFPGSPDDFAGGPGWNTQWRGIAPAAWTYLALSQDILQRLSLLFANGCEAGSTWGFFEELVEPNPSCYTSGIGNVACVTAAAAAGTRSLQVSANPGATISKSNHVIAQQHLLSTGLSGIVRYDADVYIPSATATTGQTGPELSMQNTRQVSSGQFTTSTAGIQYAANSADPNGGRWGVWAQVSPGVAAWQFSSTRAFPLSPDTLYHLTMVANFDTNRYESLAIAGGGSTTTFALGGVPIAAEPNKFTEEAFWITAEAENRWSNCGSAAATEYRLYYDNLVVRR